LENRLIEDTDLNLDNKENAWNSIIKIFKEERGQILEISKKRINNSEDEVDLDIKLKKFNKLEQQIRIINKIVGIVIYIKNKA
jgi:(p)ppGpp synthase/HD superfamily hydrolase